MSTWQTCCDRFTTPSAGARLRSPATPQPSTRRATLAVDPALLALTSLLNSARVGDVYFFRAGHHLVYEEASEILELNPAAALQQVMDHVHESSMKAADDGG